jgi:hypothetical protein
MHRQCRISRATSIVPSTTALNFTLPKLDGVFNRMSGTIRLTMVTDAAGLDVYSNLYYVVGVKMAGDIRFGIVANTTTPIPISQAGTYPATASLTAMSAPTFAILPAKNLTATGYPSFVVTLATSTKRVDVDIDCDLMYCNTSAVYT